MQSTFPIDTFEISEVAKNLLSDFESDKRRTDGLSNHLESVTKDGVIDTSRGGAGDNKLLVTKTTQRVKSTVRSRKSEEAVHLKIESIQIKSNIMANTPIRIPENVETESDQEGSNWNFQVCLRFRVLTPVFFRSLDYVYIKMFAYLYELAKKGEPIKKYDRNIIFTNGLFCESDRSQFIRRMCADSLFIASKKQQLNDKTIDELMEIIRLKIDVRLVLDLDDIIISEKIRGLPVFLTDFCRSVLDIKYQLNKGWVNDYYTERSEYDNDKIEDLKYKFADEIRIHSANAIYNSAERDIKILTDDRIAMIQICLKEMVDKRDARFKSVLSEFIPLFPDSNYEANFGVCMQQITDCPTENNKHAFDIVEQQSREAPRCEELFTERVFTDLTGLLINFDVSDGNKRRLIKILNNYLKHNFNQQLFQNQMIILISKVAENESLRTNDIFIFILLVIEKIGQNISNCFVDSLIDLINNNDSYKNYIIVILSFIRKSRELSLTIPQLRSIADDLDSKHFFRQISGSENEYRSRKRSRRRSRRRRRYSEKKR